MTSGGKAPKAPAPRRKKAAASSGDVDSQFSELMASHLGRWNTANGKGWRRLIDVLEAAKLDPDIAAAQPALEVIELFTELLSDSGPNNAMEPLLSIDKFLPAGQLGQQFKQGRKVGSVSRVRVAVRAALKRHPAATAAEVWDAIKAKPPKGVACFDSPRLGKYIQTDGAPDTGFARFANIVSEEKRRLQR